MATIAPAAAGQPAERPERPGWWPVLGGVFVGWLRALLFVVAAWVVLALLGVVGNGDVAVPPRDALDWPAYRNGWWAALANATFIAGGIAVAAWCIRGSVAARIGPRVSLPAVLGALLATGYAPVVAFHGLLRLGWLVGLLATGVLVRWLAVRPEPARRLPAVWRARLALLAGVAAFGAFGLSVAYGVTHPLRFGSVIALGRRSPDWHGQPRVTVPYHEGAVVSYRFTVANRGFAGATLVGIESRPQDAPFAVGPAAISVRVPGRGHAQLELALALTACSPGHSGAVVVLPDVVVRYRALGATHTTALPLVPAPATRCP